MEYKQNSIYVQIYKSLLYLFLKKGKRVNIKSIEVKRNGCQPETLQVDTKRQPLSGDFSLRYAVSDKVLAILWDESVKGETLRVSVSHFLVALSVTDRYKRFERLWRAFEQVVMWHKHHDAIPSKPKVFDALVEMRTYFCSNPLELSNTLCYVGTFNSTSIEKLHWDKLVKNNYVSGNKAQIKQLYDDFFDKNKDERLVGVYKKIQKSYAKEIANQGRTGDFDAIVQYYNSTRVRNDCHLLSLIVCKYCYFMRNKMFHGEVADFSFCFTNHTEDDDITDFLNGLLERLVNELICKYDTL